MAWPPVNADASPANRLPQPQGNYYSNKRWCCGGAQRGGWDAGIAWLAWTCMLECAAFPTDTPAAAFCLSTWKTLTTSTCPSGLSRSWRIKNLGSLGSVTGQCPATTSRQSRRPRQKFQRRASHRQRALCTRDDPSIATASTAAWLAAGGVAARTVPFSSSCKAAQCASMQQPQAREFLL